jgi:hypothetical protein
MNTAAIQQTSLVRCFVAYFPTKQDALDHLNVTLGTSYKHNALSRWERGLRMPDTNTRAVMLRRVLPETFARWAAGGLTADEALDRLL